MVIKRVWHGWTTLENADAYQNLLHREVFPGIEDKRILGYQSIELFLRDLGDEVEFVTIMTFDSLQNVIDFQGEGLRPVLCSRGGAKGAETLGSGISPL